MAVNTNNVQAKPKFILIMLSVLVYLTCVPLPTHVWACSVCFLAKKENLMAYFGTGVLLSVLPFALIGGFAWWLHRQMKRDERNAVAVEEQDPAREVL
jgi:hypothetical protein